MVDRFFEIVETLTHGYVVVSRSFAKLLADDSRLQRWLFDKGMGLAIEDDLADHLMLFFGPDGTFGFTDLREKRNAG